MYKNDTESIRQIRSSSMINKNELSFSQEGKILEEALLLSSAIEILTTSNVGNTIPKKDQRTIKDLSDYLTKIKSTDTSISNSEKLMLQPNDMALINIISTFETKDLKKHLEEVLVTLQKITDEGLISKQNKGKAVGISDLLRKFLEGYKFMLSQEND